MIKTRTLTLAGNGQSFDAYLARPAVECSACVLVLHDMFGLNAPIRDYADSLAQHGFAALVPNLFWRSEIPGVIPYDDAQHPTAWARLKALDLGIVAADMSHAVRWLREQPFCNGKVAALGFCGGGRFAYLAAARCGVDGAASLYGLGISEHLDEPVRCPLQLHYGLKDQHVPLKEIDAVAAGVKGRANVELFRYAEAGHSFANPVRPSYDPAAARLAGERIEAMLRTL